MKNNTTLPRSFRNNNPCNIVRTNDAWKGMSPAQTDSRFVVFDGCEWGYRAFFILMVQYYRTYGLQTIRQIICRYAPRFENNTTEYIASIARRLSFDADAKLPDLSEQSAAFWCDFAMAVTIIESGATVAFCGRYVTKVREGWVMFAQSIGISTKSFSI